MGVLAGQVVLVTGGNAGLGLGIAEGVAAAGADVVVWGRDRRRNELAGSRISAIGRRCWTFECDITDEEQVELAFRRSMTTAGRLDAVFANAGRADSPTPFVDMSFGQWATVIDANLNGTFLCLREAARFLVAQGEGGSLIATTSLSADKGAPQMHHYAASKAGIAALTKGLAVELARERIRANVLAPGWFETDLTAGVKENRRVHDSVVRRIPAGRWGMPDDLRAVAVFLADKSFVLHTGNTVVVDGGYTLT
jgi:NAD(P)-dependent dehydrogenase (short-subunit alcohol dehydrogenase family)